MFLIINMRNSNGKINWNIFLGMEYERGLFKFEWSPKFLPHILNLKEKYITNDLTITSKFKSSFTWTFERALWLLA